MSFQVINTFFYNNTPFQHFFTDPLNCSQSHYCSESGSPSIVSECPNGKIFNSKLKICVTRPFLNSQRICQKTSCDRVTNDFITVPANPAYYAYCFLSATGEEQTYLYKCDDENNKVFDLKTKACKFNCKSIGYYADPLDCNSYYICNGNGLKFSSRHVHCPPNYYFNGSACLGSSAHCPPGSIINITTSTSSMPSETTTETEEMTMKNELLDPMNEEITHTTIESTSQLSTTDIPVSSASFIVQTSTSVMDTSTKLPPQHTVQTSTSVVDTSIIPPPQHTGAIWKHMGLISVRVGRLLNQI